MTKKREKRESFCPRKQVLVEEESNLHKKYHHLHSHQTSLECFGFSISASWNESYTHNSLKEIFQKPVRHVSKKNLLFVV